MQRCARIWGILVLIGAALAGIAQAQAQPVETFRGSDVVLLARVIAKYGTTQNQLYHAYDVPNAAGDKVLGLSVSHTFELLARTLGGWHVMGACPETVQLQVFEVQGPTTIPALEPKRNGGTRVVKTSDLIANAPSILPKFVELRKLPASFNTLGPPGANYSLSTAQMIMAMAVVLDSAGLIGKLPTEMLVPLVRSPQSWAITTSPLPIAPPSVPTLVAPVNLAVDQISPVRLAWNTNADSVMVMVARDARFQDSLPTQKVEGGGSLDLALDGGAQYWWRVKGFINGNDTGWSPAWTFTVKAPEVILPRHTGVSVTPPWTARPQAGESPMFVQPYQPAPRVVTLQPDEPVPAASREIEPPSVARRPGALPAPPKSPTLPGPPRRRLPDARLQASSATPIPPRSPAEAVRPTHAQSYIIRTPKPEARPEAPMPAAPDTPSALGNTEGNNGATADIRLYVNGLDLADPQTGDALESPLCGVARVELTGVGNYREATLIIDRGERRRFTTVGPHLWLLDTVRLGDETHTLSAVVTDTAGRTRTYSFAFLVRNGRGGTGITRPDPAEEW